MLDPSRVAAQIVSGIGFLGAGIIITRRGAVHGLTTAAAVWESAAIGMAAGAGLPVVAPHFVIIYESGRGILPELLRVCGQRKRQLTETDADPHDIERDQVGVTMTLSGTRIADAAQVLANVDGVSAVLPGEDEPD